jgi:hypothetical protein
MMAMRPLHRAGADTGCGALRCPAVARDPHGRLHRARGLSDSALCNPPIAALQLGALGEMLVKQRTLDDRFHEPDHGTGDLLVDSSFAVR